MSVSEQLFWLRVRQVARYCITRAVSMLMEIGATFEQAARFVAKARA
jgi:hypothetical protein